MCLWIGAKKKKRVARADSLEPRFVIAGDSSDEEGAEMRRLYDKTKEFNPADYGLPEFPGPRHVPLFVLNLEEHKGLDFKRAKMMIELQNPMKTVIAVQIGASECETPDDSTIYAFCDADNVVRHFISQEER